MKDILFFSKAEQENKIMSSSIDILRIYICGPHSSGKTTLLNDLRPHLGGITEAEEVARAIIREHGWTREDYLPSENPDVFFQFTKEILEKQIQIENEYTENGQDFVCDRGIDPLVYAQMYVGQEAKESLYKLPGLHTWLERMKKSLVLLVSPHKECFRDDGVRLLPEMDELEAFYAAMETELALNEVPYEKITVLDRDQRVDAALKALECFRCRQTGFDLKENI